MHFNVNVETHCMRLETAARIERVDKIQETHAMRLYINIDNRIRRRLFMLKKGIVLSFFAYGGRWAVTRINDHLIS